MYVFTPASFPSVGCQLLNIIHLYRFVEIYQMRTAAPYN